MYIECELVTYAEAECCPNHKGRVKSAMGHAAAAKHWRWKQMKHKGKLAPACVLQLQYMEPRTSEFQGVVNVC